MPMHLFGWWVANTIVFQHRTHDAPGGRSKVVVMTFALTTFMLALSNSSTIKLKDLEARCAYHIFLKAFGATEARQRKIQASLGDGYPLLACWLRKQMLWRHDGSRLEPKQEPKVGSWYNRILNYVSIVLWNFCLYKLFFVHQVATHATKMHCSRLVAWCCNEIMVAAMMFMKLRAAQIAMPTAMMENGGPNPLNLNFNSLQYPTLNRNH